MVKQFSPTVLFSLTLLLVTGHAGAESPPLELGEAMARGRARAPEVEAARQREEAAQARIIEAGSYRKPQVRLSETWARTDSPAEAFAFQLNQERFSFPAFAASDPNDPDALSTAITRVEVEIPLWTGGEITTRIRQARLAAEAAGKVTAGSGDRAALAAAEAWLFLEQAREQLALLEQAREALAGHVELARAYTEQGMLVRSELLRAEVELARMDDLLAEMRGRTEIAEAGLAFRLAEPLAASFELAPLAPPPPLAEDLAAWLGTVETRPDLAAARTLLAAGELEARARKARLFPRIGIAARHDRVDDQLFGSHGESTTVMALATYDLFTGGRNKAAIAAAEAEAAAGRTEVARFEEGARLEVEQSFEAAKAAYARLATAGSAIAAADEALRITEERFRSGVAKTLDVLDAVTARREAAAREVTARVDAHLALLRLSVAAGRAPESVLSAMNPGGTP
ncbi:MAG TPA: TolC family protein [Thermoanaerobaculia bacterium]|nr:TolC family protein [Thermoanaerobaculia bacterium]